MVPSGKPRDLPGLGCCHHELAHPEPTREIHKNGLKCCWEVSEVTQTGGEQRKKWVNMLNEKGFWEGGVIPNTYNDERSLVSFQL